jgi:hypothetical protein
LTLEPLSATPATLADVDCEGEGGLMLSEFGASGAIVSLVNDTGSEHSEEFPAASVVVAVQDVAAFESAVTAMPAANAAASSVSIGLPEQVALS